jgi:hypothetical protein
LLDLVDHWIRQKSWIGLLCPLLCEPQGFPAHGLNFFCSRTCATKTRPAHPCSFLQDCRAWLHLWCAASALLPHQRPPAGMRLVGCLAYARTSVWVKGARRAWLHLASPSLLHLLATSASPPFFPARRAITVLPPPLGPRRSIFIRAVPSVVFPSTASDVLHTWPCCSRANPPATVALQLLPHRARPFCTPTQSRPELAQRRHRHALHVAVLHVVARHVGALHSSSSFSCCRIRAYSGLATSLPRTLEPRAFSARVTSWLHRPSSTRTLPHRFSSARVLPRRELRSSAAWLACHSRVYSTPPVRLCLRPRPNACRLLGLRALLRASTRALLHAPPAARGCLHCASTPAPARAHAPRCLRHRRTRLLPLACPTLAPAAAAAWIRSALPAFPRCAPPAPASRPCRATAPRRRRPAPALARTAHSPDLPRSRARSSSMGTRAPAPGPSRVHLLHASAPPLARARSVLGPPARSGPHASARAPLWRRVAPAPTRHPRRRASARARRNAPGSARLSRSCSPSPDRPPPVLRRGACAEERKGGKGERRCSCQWRKKRRRQGEEIEEKGKRDFPRTYAQFQKTAGTFL